MNKFVRSSLVGVVTAGALATFVGPISAAATPTPTTSTLSASVTLPGWPTLRQGPNSVWPRVTVRSLQYLLNAHGAHLAVDGIFGPLTNGAVRSFQASRGLPVNGIVDGHTWPALIITVTRGNTGSAVKAVQDQLNFRNLSGLHSTLLAVDGAFGPLTQAKVVGFQRGAGLVPDDIVGPLTWQALVSEFLSG